MSDDPKKDARQVPVQKSTDQLDDCQASFLILSGTFFENAGHLVLDRQATYLVLKLVFKVTKNGVLSRQCLN